MFYSLLKGLFSAIGDAICKDNTPGWPAGLPDMAEIEQFEVKKGGNRFNLLPLIPCFKPDEKICYRLIDARTLESHSFKKIEVFFRLKQNSMQFRSKTTGEMIEKITIGPSILSVVILESSVKQELEPEDNDITRIKKRKKNLCF